MTLREEIKILSEDTTLEEGKFKKALAIGATALALGASALSASPVKQQKVVSKAESTAGFKTNQEIEKMASYLIGGKIKVDSLDISENHKNSIKKALNMNSAYSIKKQMVESRLLTAYQESYNKC